MSGFTLQDAISVGSKEDQIRFRSFRNVIASISLLFDKTNGTSAQMVRALSERRPASPKAGVDVKRVTMLLRRAWATETLISLPHRRDELRSIIAPTSLWLPVQTYYAVYAALEAFFLTKGHVIQHHGPAQDHFANNYLQQMPFPLNCSVKGQDAKADYHNFNVQPNRQFSNLRFPQDIDDAEHLLALSIRTTRRAILEERYANWRKDPKRRKRLTFADKESIGKREAPTTLLHFLYRLRLRSNYQDSELFVTGPSRIESEQFSRHCVAVADYVIAALEVRVMQCIGVAAFLEEAQAFSDASRDSKPPVFDRWHAFDASHSF
jgi:hypothetical protein